MGMGMGMGELSADTCDLQIIVASLASSSCSLDRYSPPLGFVVKPRLPFLRLLCLFAAKKPLYRFFRLPIAEYLRCNLG